MDSEVTLWFEGFRDYSGHLDSLKNKQETQMFRLDQEVWMGSLFCSHLVISFSHIFILTRTHGIIPNPPCSGLFYWIWSFTRAYSTLHT